MPNTEFGSLGQTFSLSQITPSLRTLKSLDCHPHPRTAPMWVLCPATRQSGLALSPIPDTALSPSHLHHPAVAQALKPAHPTLHPRIHTYLWFPDPTPGLYRCYTSQDLQCPHSTTSGPISQPEHRDPQPHAHLPQQPRGIHAQLAAPLHRVHSPIGASPLAQDFTTQEHRDEGAGGKALLIGLWTRETVSPRSIPRQKRSVIVTTRTSWFLFRAMIHKGPIRTVFIFFLYLFR